VATPLVVVAPSLVVVLLLLVVVVALLVVVEPPEALEILQGIPLRPCSSDIVFFQKIVTLFSFPFMNKSNNAARLCPGSMFRRLAVQ
jgi:hypothetical protein